MSTIISNNLLLELKKDAKEYISLIKGENLTNTDIMIAENLMVLGFQKARAEVKNTYTFNKTRNEG